MDNLVVENRAYAKRVLFLYPHSVIQDQLITLLIQSEYEVATVNDYQKASTLLYRYPSSILFVNIEAELNEEEWEQFIRGVINTRDKHDARVGILTYNPSNELAQKYLMDVGIQCGFIGLKLGLAESAKIVLKTLEANEARGGRRYVRVKCPAGKASLNINHKKTVINGSILDISSAGLACTLDGSVEPGEVLEDVQLSLWGARLKLQVRVAGVRVEDGQKLFVFMFDKMERENVGKIYGFIKKAIQAEIDG